MAHHGVSANQNTIAKIIWVAVTWDGYWDYWSQSDYHKSLEDCECPARLDGFAIFETPYMTYTYTQCFNDIGPTRNTGLFLEGSWMTPLRFLGFLIILMMIRRLHSSSRLLLWLQWFGGVSHIGCTLECRKRQILKINIFLILLLLHANEARYI